MTANENISFINKTKIQFHCFKTRHFSFILIFFITVLIKTNILAFNNIEVYNSCHELTELSNGENKYSKSGNHNIHNTPNTTKNVKHSKYIPVVGDEHR